MKAIKMLFLSICTCIAYADDSGTTDSMEEVLEKGTYAVPILHDAPKYPSRALRKGVEGWVIVGFTVKEDGTTADIEVLTANVEDLFDQAVINAASAWTYKPATLDGKPVAQYNKSARSLFIIKGFDDTVSRSFQSKYRKTVKATKGGDFETAKRLIDELDASEKRLLAEVCYLDILKENYYKATGDQKATLRYAERALVIADEVVSKQTYIHLLKESVIQNAIAKNYQTSLERFATLQEVNDHLTSDDQIYKFAEKVRQILNGDSYIVNNGELTACKKCDNPEPRWWRDLNRNRFSIDQVVGELRDIKVTCSKGTVTINYQPDIVWTVNKDWGACLVRVYGDEGTTFRLIEHLKEG